MVLAYHGVEDAARFAVHLDWLVTHTNVVGLDQARQALLEETQAPPRAVLLTFDDGGRSFVDVAAPMLHARAMPAVAFVVAGLIDTDTSPWWEEVEQLLRTRNGPAVQVGETVRRMKALPNKERMGVVDSLRAEVGRVVHRPQLSSSELRSLERQGVVIGNHSLTHPCLDTCEDDEVHREVHESHERLTKMLGHPPTSFAYPNGNWDPRVVGALSELDYDLAFLFDHRLTSRAGSKYAVSRVRIDSSDSLDALRIRVSGLHPAIHRMRGLR